MYTVQLAKECKCFQKSEYKPWRTFETQKDAYRYATILAELMNEEFCSQHTFSAHKVEGNNFVISVDITVTPVAGYTPHISCDTGCGSTDDWSLEATDTKSKKSCS